MLAPILLFTTLNGLCYARFTSFDDAATLISTSTITTIAEDGSSVIIIRNKI